MKVGLGLCSNTPYINTVTRKGDYGDKQLS
jgi:hypothetical protein